MRSDSPLVTIYTDGACDPNPGPGGWAAILRLGKGEQVLTGSEPESTNNRMELTAAIRALEALSSPSRVTLYTDSQYLQKGISEWLPNWLKKNWRGSGGRVANRDLWEQLLSASARHQVDWRWLRAHAGLKMNERADWLARRAIRGN
jgi:ribonuclease HI